MPDLVPLVQPVYNPGVLQTVAAGASHTETTNAISATSVLLISTTDCYIQIGDTPVATASTGYLPANVPMAFTCQPTNKVSVLQKSAGGTLFVTGLN